MHMPFSLNTELLFADTLVTVKELCQLSLHIVKDCYVLILHTNFSVVCKIIILHYSEDKDTTKNKYITTA
jgi:hypothetical protein